MERGTQYFDAQIHSYSIQSRWHICCFPRMTQGWGAGNIQTTGGVVGFTVVVEVVAGAVVGGFTATLTSSPK
jgi:hypothetical protein